MTVFEAARQADCVQAAEKLGIRTRRSGGKAYACCLFHAEKTPSLCLYPDSGGFYCFGCHAHGDVVALYAQALSLSPLEAAKRVCADFGYDYDRRRKRGSYLPGKAPALNVRTLAKRLDDWREEKVRALLEIQRAAEARMEQIEESKDYIAAAEDETWRAALVEKCAAQERIALLDSLSLPELLQEMKEETYGAQRTLIILGISRLRGATPSVMVLAGVVISAMFSGGTTLLLLDEPTSNLDPRNQYEMLSLVRRIAREQGITVLIVIHDLNLALRYCDRFYFLKDGKGYSYGGAETVTAQTIETVYGIHAEIAEVSGKKVVLLDECNGE